jgi:hypothetical protein
MPAQYADMHARTSLVWSLQAPSCDNFALTTNLASSSTRCSVTHLQAQELDGSATLQVDFRHVESTDAELAGLIQQHHYRIELGLRQVAAVPPTPCSVPSNTQSTGFCVLRCDLAVGLCQGNAAPRGPVPSPSHSPSSKILHAASIDGGMGSAIHDVHWP